MSPGEGERFPDLDLLDHAGNRRRLSTLVAGDPTVLQFYRGWWCPATRSGSERNVQRAPRPARNAAATGGEELRRDMREIARAVRADWEAPTP